jgi:hypothetical protein
MIKVAMLSEKKYTQWMGRERAREKMAATRHETI